MRKLRTVSELREALAPERRARRSIGLVPTMGAFHGGHLSLIRRAREQTDVVVVSLFVNPTQFGPGEDLETYPRDEARDAELAEAEGVDVLFSPSVDEVYPEGFATTVTVGGLTDVLDGAPAAAAPPISPASPPWSPSFSTWPHPTWPTSARRTPSRRS